MIKEIFKDAGKDWFNKDFHNRIKWLNKHIGANRYSYKWVDFASDDVIWTFRSGEDEVFYRLTWIINEYSRT